MTKPKPGDLCQFTEHDGQRTTTHYECDQHPNGTVTLFSTGKVIKTRGEA